MMSIISVTSYLKALLSQYKIPNSIEELKEINQLIYKGSFEKTLKLIENIKTNDVFLKYDKNDKYYNSYLEIYKAITYIELGKFDDAKKLLEDVETVSVNSDFKDLQIRCRLELASIYIKKGEVDKAKQNLNEIKANLLKNKYYLKDNFYQLHSIYYYLDAKVHRIKGNLDEATSNLENSIILKKTYSNNFEIAPLLNDLGIIYGLKGDVNNAKKYLNQSLDIYKSLGNESTILKIYNNLGVIQMNLADFEGAYQNYMLALPICEKLANITLLTQLKLNLALVNREKGDIKGALDQFNECLKIFMDQDDKIGYANVLNQIASLKLITGDLDEAFNYLNKALEIEKKLGHKSEIATCISNIANIYQYKGDYENAIIYDKQAYELIKEVGVGRQIIFVLQSLIDIYIVINDRETAKIYLDEMKKEISKNPTKFNENSYQLANANYLASSDRVINKADAQRIYMKIINEEMINQDITIEGLLGLTRLLLAELKIVKSEEVLSELREVMDKLYLLTDTSKGASVDRYQPRIQTLILRSQLAIVDLDIEFAQKLLQEGYDLAESKGLTQLKEQVKNEQDKLNNDLLSYKKMVEKNASIYERLQQSQIENYLARAQSILKR